MPRLQRHPAAWFAAWLGWFALLWFLSSLEGSPLTPPPLPHFDKFEHFTFFAIGGFLLAAWDFRRHPNRTSWKPALAAIVLVMAAIGFIDEWHQCYTPGRSGADPWDWLADLLGGFSGACLLKAIHRRIE